MSLFSKLNQGQARFQWEIQEGRTWEIGDACHVKVAMAIVSCQEDKRKL